MENNFHKNNGKRRVEASNELIMNLLDSYRRFGDKGFLDYEALDQLYAYAIQSLEKSPSRIRIYDHTQVFIDGERFDGLTPFQVEILEFIAKRGSASVDSLIDEVWRNSDASINSIKATVCRMNRLLAKAGCFIEKKGPIIIIQFNNRPREAKSTNGNEKNYKKFGKNEG